MSNRVVITHADDSVAGVRRSSASVCLCVCDSLSARWTKTDQTTITSPT